MSVGGRAGRWWKIELEVGGLVEDIRCEEEEVAEWRTLAVFGVDISTSHGHTFTSLPQL